MAQDGIKKWFSSTSKTNTDREPPKKPESTVRTPKREIVDLTVNDSSEDDEDSKMVVDMTVTPEKASSSSQTTSPTSLRRSSDQKVSAASPAKTSASRKRNLSSSSSLTSPAKRRDSGIDAKVVLARIPDAEVPEVEPGQKPNFYTMDRQQHEAPQAGISSEPLEAAPDCLTGLTFVITGQLPTLGREEITAAIKRLGGNVTGSISGRTSALVLGADAGPSKIKKAKDNGLKIIDEDGFRQLLKEMPTGGGSGDAALKARARQAKESEAIAQKAAEIRQRTHVTATEERGATSSTGPISNKGTKISSQGDLWTTRYAPRELSDICGNNAAVKRLKSWLENWPQARKRNFAKTTGVEGSEFRAALIHGPPGIGKTTAAHLVGNLLGYDVIEYNASDTRSKTLLNSEVARTLENLSLFSGSKGEKPIMVVMDEVDGMSAGDRGGVGAMAAFARTTNVPLVCICNDRTLPKMRPFDRVTFDIPFRRPDASTVRQRLMVIASAEGIKLDPQAVEQLTLTTRSDIRQMINLISTFSTTEKHMTFNGSQQFSKTWNKEIVLKPFDIVQRYLSRSPLSLNDKIELYFNDYDFAPLMVQENYLVTAPSLAAAAEAAEYISDGDMVDRQIHGSQQQWSLMPLHAIMSCVLPSTVAGGHARGRYNFAGWLGQNSKTMKNKRLLAELRSHMRLRAAATTKDLRLEYHPTLVKRLLGPLTTGGDAGIPEVISFMDAYYLTREDWDVVMELGVGPKSSELAAKAIPTATKTSFTRNYNKVSHPLPFMRSMDSKAAAKTSKVRPDLDDVVDDDMEPEPEQSQDPTLEDVIANDKYIKAVKAKATKAKSGSKTGTKRAPAKSRASKKS